MKKIITIGRQTGSGGHIVGKLLAEQLNIDFYDNEILEIAAKESGICEDDFKFWDEKKKFDFLGRLFSLKTPPETDFWSSSSILSGESLFKIQSDIIKNIADKKSAVFVGRAIDYILRDYSSCINIFLSANFEDRIKRISEVKNISEKEAANFIEKNEKQRSAFYNYYSDKQWGAANSYHLCLNTSILGINDTVEFIKIFVEKFFNQNE